MKKVSFLMIEPSSPPDQPSVELEEKFDRLSEEWKSEAEFLSSPDQMAMLPSYQRIIGMGPIAVPLILREMEREPHFWFWALRSITGEDPVPERSRGNVPEMVKAWLAWANRRNFSNRAG